MEFFTLIFSVMLRGTSVCCCALSSSNPFTFNSFHSSFYSLCATQTRCATPCILPARPVYVCGNVRALVGSNVQKGENSSHVPFSHHGRLFPFSSLSSCSPPYPCCSRPCLLLPGRLRYGKVGSQSFPSSSPLLPVSPTGFFPYVPPVPTPLPL
jgi:hypothetical protein